jgi:hypothetical protein
MKVRLTLFLLLALSSASAQIDGDPVFPSDSSLFVKDSLGGHGLRIPPTSIWLYTGQPLPGISPGRYPARANTSPSTTPSGKAPRPIAATWATWARRLRARSFLPGALSARASTSSLDAYDYLRRPLDSLLFYRTGQAYTRAIFSQGVTQENTALELEFGREFGQKTLALSLYYHRLNNQGAYIHQRAELTSFAFGIWIKPQKKGYQAFLRYGSNVNQLEHNGGIEEQPSEIEPPIAIPVLTESPQTRYASKELGLVQHLRLFVAGAETKKRAGQLDLVHDFLYRQNTYKFYDENPEPDSAFYGIFQVDQRGIRNFIEHQSLRNALKLHFFTSLAPDSTGIRRQRLRWEAGLVHTYHSWNAGARR